jgi:hypothetical protein
MCAASLHATPAVSFFIASAYLGFVVVLAARRIRLLFFSQSSPLSSDQARILHQCVRRQIFRTGLFRQMAN